MAQWVKTVPANQKSQETRVQFLDQEDPLKKGMATVSSILAWRTLRTEEPGRLQSMESQKSDMTERLTLNFQRSLSREITWLDLCFRSDFSNNLIREWVGKERYQIRGPLPKVLPISKIFRCYQILFILYALVFSILELEISQHSMFLLYSLDLFSKKTKIVNLQFNIENTRLSEIFFSFVLFNFCDRNGFVLVHPHSLIYNYEMACHGQRYSQ